MQRNLDGVEWIGVRGSAVTSTIDRQRSVPSSGGKVHPGVEPRLDARHSQGKPVVLGVRDAVDEQLNCISTGGGAHWLAVSGADIQRGGLVGPGRAVGCQGELGQQGDHRAAIGEDRVFHLTVPGRDAQGDDEIRAIRRALPEFAERRRDEEGA